jgi:hypothetical protein
MDALPTATAVPGASEPQTDTKSHRGSQATIWIDTPIPVIRRPAQRAGLWHYSNSRAQHPALRSAPLQLRHLQHHRRRGPDSAPGPCGRLHCRDIFARLREDGFTASTRPMRSAPLQAPGRVGAGSGQPVPAPDPYGRLHCRPPFIAAVISVSVPSTRPMRSAPLQREPRRVGQQQHLASIRPMRSAPLQHPLLDRGEPGLPGPAPGPCGRLHCSTAKIPGRITADDNPAPGLCGRLHCSKTLLVQAPGYNAQHPAHTVGSIAARTPPAQPTRPTRPELCRRSTGPGTRPPPHLHHPLHPCRHAGRSCTG